MNEYTTNAKAKERERERERIKSIYWI